MTVTEAADHPAVAAKLRRLREHYGYLTRAELGEPVPCRDPDEDWPSYDVVTLGLAPHCRETCRYCRAVGA